MEPTTDPPTTDDEDAVADPAPGVRHARARRLVVGTVALSLAVMIIGVARSAVRHGAERSVAPPAMLVAETHRAPDPALPSATDLAPRSAANVANVAEPIANVAPATPPNAPPASKTSTAPRSTLARRDHAVAERTPPAPAQRPPEIARDPGF